MQNIQKGLRIIVEVLSGIIAVFVLGTLLFTEIGKVGISIDLSNRILLEDYVHNTWIILGVFIFILIWKKNNCGQKCALDTNRWKVQMFLSSILVLILQVYFTYHIYFYSGNDAFNLRTGAEYFVNGEYNSFYNLEYFQGCPNNLMAYMIYIVATYLAEFIGVEPYVLLIGLNIILSDAALIFSSLTVYRLTLSRKIMWGAYWGGVLLFGITPWLSVPYTDMFSIATPIAIFYLYLCLREKEIPTLLKWFCIIFVSFLMYDLKPLNIIVFIAIFLCELLYIKITKEIIGKLVIFLIALVLAVGGRTVVKIGIEQYVGYEPNENKVFAMDWVLFLGSNYSTYGQWSYEDFQYALQFEDKDERQKELLNSVGSRMKDMGISGYVSHLMNKIHVFYNDGNFGWGTTGGVVYEIPERNDAVSMTLRNIIYPPEEYGFVSNYPGYGMYFQYYAVMRQIIWLTTICFMIYGICRPTKDKTILVLKVAWIGVFIFTMLFETHARLLISFLPIFVVMAGVGAANMKNEI